MAEHVAEDALRAASATLAKHGLEGAGIVVNIAWRDPTGKNEFAVGTAAPTRYPMLADSLRQSAEEVEDSHA
jgi:hypothetical protein